MMIKPNIDFKITTSNFFLSEETKIGLFNYFKLHKEKDVADLLYWINSEHQNLIFDQREFIFPRILQFKHFRLADKLIEDNIVYFDEKIAKSCSFHLALEFDNDIFDFWLLKVEQNEKRFQMIKDFWSEFLNFQFQRDDEVDGNLNNLKYVINKIPFYEKSSYDMKNGSLIKMRSKFFTKDINDLQEKNKEKILVLLGSLLGENYFLFEESIQEEFKSFPLIIDKFNLFKEKKELHNSIKNAVSERKIKV